MAYNLYIALGDKVAQLTVYSLLPQSSQLQNGYLALIRQCLELVRYMLAMLWHIPRGIEMVSMCTGMLGEEGRVSASVDTRLYTEYLYCIHELNI